MLKRIVKISVVAGLFALVVAVSAYVTLTWIIRAEETVVVPDLREKDLVAVLDVLTTLGLNAKVKTLEYHPRVPKSQVIFQDPAPGEEVKKGRDVRIAISKGPRTVYMPGLAGGSVEQGLIVLEENGLCRGNLSDTYSDHHEKGRIIAHEPPQGTAIDRTRCVNLLFSLGKRPEAHATPDLIGIDLDAALLKMETLGLVPGEMSYSLEMDRPRNVIIHQQPLPGQRVLEGSRIDLVVNRPRVRRHEAGIDDRDKVLYRYRVKNGFLNHHIQVQLNGFGRSLNLFDEFVKPGRELWFLAPKGDGASILFYDNGRLAGGKKVGLTTEALKPKP